MTDIFSTTDLYYSAFLKASGIPMTRVDRNGKRLTFVFDASLHNLAELQRKWWGGKEDLVSARAYADEIKNLKGLCHSLWRPRTAIGSCPPVALCMIW